ncbi:hypothetical protein K501DRAFT_274790 [Backusella circina FSU 941]|nr:hypothetical protein K501DRAFT_274790 [Backusella circina FSU 941]
MIQKVLFIKSNHQCVTSHLRLIKLNKELAKHTTEIKTLKLLKKKQLNAKTAYRCKIKLKTKFFHRIFPEYLTNDLDLQEQPKTRIKQHLRMPIMVRNKKNMQLNSYIDSQLYFIISFRFKQPKDIKQRRYPPQPRICSAQPTVRPPQLTGHPSQPSQPASENRRRQWRQYYNRNKRRINRARMARSRQQGVRENDEDQQQQKTTKNNYEIKGIFK